jgi:hypothetical protein
MANDEVPEDADGRFREELERDSRWLRNFLIDNAGHDCDFNSFLGRSPGTSHSEFAQDVFEKDRIELLAGVFRYLKILLGDEERAAEWLFHNEALKAVGGSDPYDYVKEGHFDALWLLHDFLALRALQARLGQPKLEKEALPSVVCNGTSSVDMDELFDLLQAAWGLTDEEFEQLLRAPAGWVRARRNHEVPSDKLGERLARLLKLHQAFRLVMDPRRYASAWRRPWHPESPLRNRSPWEAYVSDGDAALDVIQSYFAAQR